MEQSIYVALSGQIALQRRLDTLAHNVANSSTPGFRATETKFATVLSEVASNTAFASTGDSYISLKSGNVMKTGNPLDVAVAGNAYFAIETPEGIAYTRDGRFQMSNEGGLVSVTGAPVLDIGGAPIQLRPGGGPVTIASDGMISQDNFQLGAIGLFTIDPGANVTRRGNSGIFATEVQPALDFNSYGVRQGYIESANIDPVTEISQLIAVTRAFEALSNSVAQVDETMRDSIRTLGGR